MNTLTRSEAAAKCDFSTIRYAQCWEDADILVAALDIQPAHTCLAIGSAGDNALALLAKAPRRVVAIDLNPAQLAALELRVAAYRSLDDAELLRFVGARPASDRLDLYRRCIPELSPRARGFWNAHEADVRNGIFSAGRFERYLRTFRTKVLPLVHSSATIEALLTPKSAEEREAFYNGSWDTWQWRAAFRLFFSQAVMGAFGRDPRFFDYSERDVAAHLLRRTRHALVDQDPSINPYLHWMLTGSFGEALPYALRPENARAIRANLDRISWRESSLESYLATEETLIDRFALSDIFEYVSAEGYAEVLRAIVARSAPQARLAYWNMLVERTRPPELAEDLAPDYLRANTLHAADKTFFYSSFIIENAR